MLMKCLIFSKKNCPQCDVAKDILRNFDLTVKTIGEDTTKEELLEHVPLARSVPQIFINDIYVGGLKELEDYMRIYSTS